MYTLNSLLFIADIPGVPTTSRQLIISVAGSHTKNKNIRYPVYPVATSYMCLKLSINSKLNSNEKYALTRLLLRFRINRNNTESSVQLMVYENRHRKKHKYVLTERRKKSLNKSKFIVLFYHFYLRPRENKL